MQRPDTGSSPGVSVFREGRLDGEIAQRFAAGQLSAVTHLPTGGQDSRVEILEAAPGGAIPACVEEAVDLLLQVVAGDVRLLWGPRLDQTAFAAAGDALLVPAGIPFQARNDSPVHALQFILVRGS